MWIVIGASRIGNLQQLCFHQYLLVLTAPTFLRTYSCLAKVPGIPPYNHRFSLRHVRAANYTPTSAAE